MKKLMIAVSAAALCGAVFAEVNSQVVGFQDKSVGKFALTAQTFLKTGGDDGVTFGDIKPNSAFVNGGTLQLFTADGQAGELFVYQNDPEILEIFEAQEGWYLFSDEELTTPKNGQEIGYGNGYVAKAKVTGSELTYSGEVKSGETEIPIGKFALTGNVLPSDMTLANLTPNAQFVSGGTIQFFTADGQAGDLLVYQNDPEILEIFEAKEGWYLFSDEELTTPKNATQVYAGDVFVAKAKATGATLSWDAVLPVAE